jgi:hypothetical protein
VIDVGCVAVKSINFKATSCSAGSLKLQGATRDSLANTSMLADKR